MDDRPNVQVIFTSKPPAGPGLGTVLVEIAAFVLFVVMVGLVLGAGLM